MMYFRVEIRAIENNRIHVDLGKTWGPWRSSPGSCSPLPLSTTHAQVMAATPQSNGKKLIVFVGGRSYLKHTPPAILSLTLNRL